jgi:hypothetical protein
MGVVWATCAVLPFLETLTFNAHVSTGRRMLSTDDYLRLALLFVFLWALMCIVFLIEKNHISRVRLHVRKELESWREKLKDARSWAIRLLVLVALAYIFAGRQASVEAVKGSIKDYLTDTLLLVGGMTLIWVVAKFVGGLGESSSRGVREGIEGWEIGLRAGSLFYLFLVAGTLIWVSFGGVGEDRSITMRLSLFKDYALLFIISGLLYLGLFRLARARALSEVFKNVYGFLHFVVICGIIAVFAVWADYRELDPVRLEHLFTNEWQRRYMEVHVVTRDIAFLLFPIGILLFWTLKCVAAESPKEKHA